MCIMGMERVYIGESEPKGPFKPSLWIKNDSVEGMAIYIRVGGRYVKYNQCSSDDETLYINATIVENPTQDLQFTIDKTQEEIDDAIRTNKLIMFSINQVVEGALINKIQCSNLTTVQSEGNSAYIFEWTSMPFLSAPCHAYFAFSWEDGVFKSSTVSYCIPEINVENQGTALNYNEAGGGFLSVNVDGSTVGINENNQLCILNNNNND